MNETKYHILSEKEINYIFDYIDANYTSVDTDFLDNTLYISLKSTEQYVINKHIITKQLWLSSPESGAHYFTYDEKKEKWLDNNGNNLISTISQELDKLGLE